MILASILGSGLAPWLVAPASSAAAEPSSDIPGLALPGPVAAGRLGGTIYDVVYRIDVAPGHVIVASLTGTAGTDFDIYLFGSSATTVLANVDLLRKSVGPTSTESLSWASSRGGIYYIDLNGATDVEGDYRLAVQTVPDATPPSVTAVLADGRRSTNQLTMPLVLEATDDLSGVAEIATSADGTLWGEWIPFDAAITWTFTPGDGERSVWVKVRNGVGLESTAARATVTIDTDPPSATGLEPPPSSTVVGLRPPFRVTFDEPMDATTWADLGLIVQSASGSLIPGSYTYDPVKRVGTFVPTIALDAGGTYVVTLGSVADVAGNRVAPMGSWTVTALAPATLEVALVPRVIALGGSARIDVSLSGAPLPAEVQVEAGNVASGFTPLPPLDGSGPVSLTVKPNANTTYRFHYDGAPGVAVADVEATILVRRSVALLGRNSAVVARASAGSSVMLTAVVGPAAARVPVSFRLYRFDPVARRWVYAGSHGRNTDAVGRARYTWVPQSAGTFYWRAVAASTADLANNTSAVYRWTVSR